MLKSVLYVENDYLPLSSPCPSPPPLPSSSLTSFMTHLPHDPEALIYLVLLQARNQGAFNGFNRTPESL